MRVRHKIDKGNNPKLSILVLSSGRENTIERCLRSFDAIKKAIQTEIIVVDTDKTKNQTVNATLKKYATHIVTFEWCDDFSAARNAGFAVAEGAWVLYVDDDEWFMDSKPIIDFFLTGEYLKYHWCNIRVRNYLKEDFSEYSDAWVSRMFKVLPNSGFHGVIHEYFEPLIGEAKVLEAKLGHTGYIFKTEEENKAHSKRNVTLLEKAIEDDPKNTRFWIQIVQEYGALGEYDTQRRLCEKYIALSKRIKTDSKTERYFKNLQGLFVGCRVRIEVMGNRWQQARIVHDKYAKTHDYGVVADGFLYLMGAIFYYNMGEFAKSSVMCNAWINKCAEYKKKPTDYAEDEIYFLGEAFDENAIVTIGTIINLIKKYSGAVSA